MATYSKELESLFQRYIHDSETVDRIKLRELLHSTSVLGRYHLLKTVRGLSALRGWTGLHEIAYTNDMDTLRHLLEFFTSDQVCTVTKIQCESGATPLLYAASRGYTDVVRYILERISQMHGLELLRLQDNNGNTALHTAASMKQADIVQLILTSIAPEMKMELLLIRNKKRRSVLDMNISDLYMRTEELGDKNSWGDLESKYDQLVEESKDQVRGLAKTDAQVRQLVEQNLKMKKVEVEQRQAITELVQQIKMLEEENYRQAEELASQKQRFEIMKKEMSQQRQEMKMMTTEQGKMKTALNELSIYLRTAECTDATGDQEIEDF